jgi:hypothetical protein
MVARKAVGREERRVSHLVRLGLQPGIAQQARTKDAALKTAALHSDSVGGIPWACFAEALQENPKSGQAEAGSRGGMCWFRDG